MEKIIVNTLDILEKIERDHGRLGTIVGILVLIISTIFAATLIFMIGKWWLEVAGWAFELILPGWKFK